MNIHGSLKQAIRGDETGNTTLVTFNNANNIDANDENHLDRREFNSKSIGDWGGDQTVQSDWPAARVEDEQFHRARTGVGGDEPKI